MQFTPPDQLAEEVRLGEEMYDRVVKPLMKSEDHGKYVAIDVHNGEWEMDADDYTAVMRLRNRLPAESRVHLMCVGWPTAYRMLGITREDLR